MPAPTTTTTTPYTSTAPARSKVRKRASKACLCCRARKVRCDVSQRGRPCMNCYLDGETCVVTGRANRHTSLPLASSILSPVILSAVSASRTGPASGILSPVDTLKEGNDAKASNGAGSANNAVKTKLSTVTENPLKCHIETNSALEAASGGHTAMFTTPPPPVDAAPDPVIATELSSHVSIPNPTTLPSLLDKPPLPSCTDDLSGRQARLHGSVTETRMPDYTDPFQCAFNAIATDMTTPGIANINQSSPEIMYTYYPFLTITSLPRLLPQDVNYLEQQGCMRIPTRPILDEFVQQYFLHVHPMMPLFHEGDFWDQYSQQNMPCETGSAPSSTRMSVLAFQALLFASCNFVSEASVRALGFPTIRAARAALYRRAKLLYDFDTEPSAVVCAQAALLLTFWSPYGNKKINSVWLNIAVQQARLAEAHLYASLSRHNRHTNKLKRLWWCCIIRDRLLSLGVRRSIQIPRTQFDIDHHPPLNVGDLADEIAYSRVYNLETKKCLVAIVARVAELSVVLTDVLMLAYPPYAPTWDAEEDQGRLHRESEQSDKCKLSLNQWYASVSLQLPLFGGPASDALSMSAQRATTGAGYSHDSVILYTNLMYMYYHSGRIALYHQKALNTILSKTFGRGQTGQTRVSVESGKLLVTAENRRGLQDAASEVTECLNELVRRRLARWLPISAVPITAFPLFLQTVDVKLSTLSITASMQPDLIAPARKQRHLDILIEAMRTYQPQYEGVDWVRESICHAVNLAQLDGLPSLPQTQTVRRPRNVYDWTDIFENNPSSYLRLTFSMDIALRTNRLPEEHDFPKSLRGLFTGGFSPIRNLFCSAASAAMSGSPTTPAPRMQSPQLVSGILSENNTSCAKQAPRCNGQQTPPPQATTTVDGDVYLSTMTPSNLFLDDEGTIMDDFSLYYGMELGSTEVDRVTELDEPMPQSNIEDDD